MGKMTDTNTATVDGVSELESEVIQNQHRKGVERLYKKGWRLASLSDYCQWTIQKGGGPNVPRTPVLLKEGAIINKASYDLLVRISPVVLYLDQALQAIKDRKDYHINGEELKALTLDSYIEKRQNPFSVPYDKFDQDGFTVWALGGEGLNAQKSTRTKQIGEKLHNSPAQINEILVYPSGKGGMVEKPTVRGIWAEKEGHRIKIDFFSMMSDHPLQIGVFRRKGEAKSCLTYNQVVKAYLQHMQLLQTVDPDNVKSIGYVLRNSL